jgi:hypothetical protein
MSEQKVRQILSLSGGKDSTALAIYMRDRVPDLEYVFCDTEMELPETYDYLERLEAYLGRPIVRLKHDGRGFEHWLVVYGNYLPSPQSRWCTRHLKIQPFERFVGNDRVRSYIGIRADEDREGYISHKPGIEPVYPFKEAGIVKSDVFRLLDNSGLGIPSYYRWRSRSGCFFCFFQQKIEWVGLRENHPDLFEQATKYEKLTADLANRYTWSAGESLEELALPERVARIRSETANRLKSQRQRRPGMTLLEALYGYDDEAVDQGACLICDL